MPNVPAFPCMLPAQPATAAPSTAPFCFLFPNYAQDKERTLRRPNRQRPGATGSVPDGSVHADFHRNPDQVGVVLGAKLLLEQ